MKHIHNILWSSLFLNLSKCCLERIGTRQKKENKKGEKMKGEGVPTPPPQPGQATFPQLPVNGAWELVDQTMTIAFLEANKESCQETNHKIDQ